MNVSEYIQKPACVFTLYVNHIVETNLFTVTWGTQQCNGAIVDKKKIPEEEGNIARKTLRIKL